MLGLGKIRANLKFDRLPKLLPERFIFIAREQFFRLNRISGFGNHQDLIKHEIG